MGVDWRRHGLNWFFPCTFPQFPPRLISLKRGERIFGEKLIEAA
jgi:hypothetical protein